jgi:16S rRNA (uracil1498-N3)-methyltransferase
VTRRRWIADEVHGDTAALTGDHASHLNRVLRAKVGQEFDIATGDAVRRGKITAISADRVEFALGAELAANPTPALTLVLAIFKFDRMEWAIEKCTEIGVARIIPLIASRTDSHLAAAAGKRHERWQRIALQASEQSRRPAPPEIAEPITFKDLASLDLNRAGDDSASLANYQIASTRIVLSESGTDRRLRGVLASRTSDLNEEVILAVGPEGGWTDDEFRWFRESGWTSASLGDNILRTETAAIAAAALAIDALT